MRLKTKPRFWVITIAVMTAVFGVSIAAGKHDLRLGARQLEAANAQYAQLESEVEALQEKLAYVQTDDYIIRVARDELGLVMPGEVRYVNGS